MSGARTFAALVELCKSCESDSAAFTLAMAEYKRLDDEYRVGICNTMLIEGLHNQEILRLRIALLEATSELQNAVTAFVLSNDPSGYNFQKYYGRVIQRVKERTGICLKDVSPPRDYGATQLWFDMVRSLYERK